MSTYRDQLTEHLLELAWSQFTEMGVPGVVRHHDQSAIDPDALVLLCAALCDDDPRLADESIDWCAEFGDAISIARVKNLVRAGLGDDTSFARYAATVNAHSSQHWPVSSKRASDTRRARPLSVTRSHKAREPDLGRPALVRLRLRALFGIGARADVLFEWCACKDAAFSAADLARIGYSKRQIANTLSDLVRAGLIARIASRNAYEYRLADPPRLRSFVGALPRYAPPWAEMFSIVLTMRTLAEAGDRVSAVSASVDTQKTLADLATPLFWARWQPPAPARPTELWETTMQWALQRANEIAQGVPDTPAIAAS